MEYKIDTGTFLPIKTGKLFNAKLNIMYCGMPNKTTFALTPLRVRGNQGFSPTVFYSTANTFIKVLDVRNTSRLYRNWRLSKSNKKWNTK